MGEILQNWVIFNEGVHKSISEKEFRDDRTIILEHGKPMIFGKNKDKGLILDGFDIKAVTIGENGITENDLLVHDAKCKDNIFHRKLAMMNNEEGLPVAMGVIRAVEAPVYDQEVEKQIADVQAKKKERTLRDYLLSCETWEVK